MLIGDMLMGVAIGGVIAGFSLFIANLSYRYCLRPKLDIIEEELPREQKLKYPFIRVVVKNEGETAAQNCVGKISFDNVSATDLCDRSPSFISPDPSKFIPITRMSLHWANTFLGGGCININAYDDEALDVGKLIWIEGNIYCIDVFSEQGLSPMRCSLKHCEDKEYEGTIHITAANAKGKEKNFIMRMKGGKINLRLKEITEGWTRRGL